MVPSFRAWYFLRPWTYHHVRREDYLHITGKETEAQRNLPRSLPQEGKSWASTPGAADPTTCATSSRWHKLFLEKGWLCSCIEGRKARMKIRGGLTTEPRRELKETPPGEPWRLGAGTPPPSREPALQYPPSSERLFSLVSVSIWQHQPSSRSVSAWSSFKNQ